MATTPNPTSHHLPSASPSPYRPPQLDSDRNPIHDRRNPRPESHRIFPRSCGLDGRQRELDRSVGHRQVTPAKAHLRPPDPVQIIHPRYPSWRSLAVLSLLPLFIELTVNLWFKPALLTQTSQKIWLAPTRVAPADSTIPLRLINLPPEIRAELRSDSITCLSWEKDHGTEGRFFLIQWNSGRVSALASSIHRPELCLTASGYTLKQFLGLTPLFVDRESIPFQTYLFESRSGPIHVFFGSWLGSGLLSGSSPTSTPPTLQNRLRQILQRQPAQPRQIIEIALSGARSVEEAARVAENVLSQSLEWTPRLP